MMQGGYQSLEEAVHYRVPVLGIPMIIDQRQNVLKLLKWGAGEMVDFNRIEPDSLTKVIKRMMTESR